MVTGPDPESQISYNVRSMSKTGFVYFMCNSFSNVLYIGVTNNLIRRVAEHKAKINKGFTDLYNCDKLVYFEVYDSMNEAIAREKQLKNWKREWKNELVNKENCSWIDLSDSIGLTLEVIDEVKGYHASFGIKNEIPGQARDSNETL